MSTTYSLPIPHAHAFLAATVMSLLKLAEVYLPYLTAEAAFPWVRFLGLSTIGYFLWALGAPLLWRLAQGAGGAAMLWQRVVRHLFLAVVVACVHGCLESLLLLGWVRAMGGVANVVNSAYLLNMIMKSLVAYGIILGAFLAMTLSLRVRHKEFALALSEQRATLAQLRALKMQLNPHFLFNALHSVGALMEESIDEAQKVLARLASLLRAMLDADQRHTAPLRDELAYIDAYLSIERVRFVDRLSLRREVDENLLEAEIPYLILQPLVENAIKHGFAGRTEGGTIRIIAQRSGARLQLMVADDGDGCNDPEQAFRESGVGTRNVRDRLASLYGNDFDFRFLTPEEGGFAAVIDIPCSLKPMPADGL